MSLTQFGKEESVHRSMLRLGFRKGKPRRILEAALIKKLNTSEIDALAYLVNDLVIAPGGSDD